MGLDALDLTFNIEKKFDIKLPDDLDGTSNVGDLHRLVSQHYFLHHVPKESCFEEVFNRLKKNISSDHNIPKDQLKPETQTETIFPEADRIKKWKYFSKSIQLKLPALQRPAIYNRIRRILSYFFWAVILILLICLFGVASVPSVLWISILMSFSILFFVTILFLLLSYWGKYKKQIIPSSCATLGGLSRAVTVLNKDVFELVDDDELLEALILLISDCSGLSPQEIKPETTLKDIFPYG